VRIIGFGAESSETKNCTGGGVRCYTKLNNGLMSFFYAHRTTVSVTVTVAGFIYNARSTRRATAHYKVTSTDHRSKAAFILHQKVEVQRNTLSPIGSLFQTRGAATEKAVSPIL